jgi:hypothetical protein
MDEQPRKVRWLNFRTGEYDRIDTSRTDYSDYIPQTAAAQALYKMYLMKGKTPRESWLDVLFANWSERCKGEDE